MRSAVFATAVAGTLVQGAASPSLSVPRARIDVLGPTIIRVSADTPAGERVYSIEARRRLGAAGAEFERVRSLSRAGESGTRWTALESTQPASTNRYQVRAWSGSERPGYSNWSDDLVVTTPPAPASPPAAPLDLAAAPLNSYQIELTWRTASDNEYGFEIVRTDRKPAVRYAIVNPKTTRVVVHGQQPGSTASFAVRAFNPIGVSPLTSPATAHLPPLPSKGTPTGRALPPGACTTREAAMDAVESEGDGDLPSRDPNHYAQRLGGQSVDVFEVPGVCGQNCMWSVYGRAGGCYRKLGSLFGVDWTVIGATPAGAPLVLARSHAGGGLAIYDLRMLSANGFVALDEFAVCTFRGLDEPLEALTPVFDDCQFDQRLRPKD
jgi:hypothetical protein